MGFNTARTFRIPPREGYQLLRQNGFDFEGYWRKNQRNGFGVLLKLRSECPRCLPQYKGNWQQNKRNGLGNGYFKNGGYYHGNWKNGKRDGYGRMWYGDGSFYDGNWVNGKRRGLGLFVEVNGNRYEGEWKDDMKHGMGKYFHLLTGQLQEGVWDKNMAICSSMEDIPFRQTSPYPTSYPIQEATLEKSPYEFFKEALEELSSKMKSKITFKNHDSKIEINI